METPIRSGDILLGKYRVERVLGQGGMGVVVAARHIELGELFAVKFMLPQALSQPQSIERFLREARAVARLKDEHVAKVHDFGRLENGAPYMVMEYLEGSDLKDVLHTRGPLPVDEVVTLVLQACEAIAEAHALKIIHRDLKPANLFLIRRRNGTPCIKVLDFGISKEMATEAGDLTENGESLGSPLHMSPEQMVRMKDVDTRTDIWAMGVILYELATGAAPFHADTLHEIVGRVLQGEPVPPRHIRPDLPAWFEDVVGKCLRKRPEQRFQSIEELAEALTSHREAARMLANAAADAPSMDTLITVPLLARAAAPSAASLPPAEPRAALPSIPAAPTPGPGPRAITQSTWGRTGTGPKPPPGARRMTAAITSVVGLAVAASAAFLFLGRPSPADSVEPRLNSTASPAAVVSPAAGRGAPAESERPAPLVAPAPATEAARPAPSAAPSSSAAPSIKPKRPPRPKASIAPSQLTPPVTPKSVFAEELL